MSFETIEVRKLNPVIGAEIHGVDLSKPLTNRQVEEIHQAWMDNLVIVFRDQPLSPEQHVAFSKYFGELQPHPSRPSQQFIEIVADETSTKVAGEYWHSDISCEEVPPMGSLLYLNVVPPDGGGDTMFANMYRAFETLSPPIQDMLMGLTAVHDSRHVFPKDSRFPNAEHPIVRTHPVTGRRALYVNSQFTTHIVGLNRNESAAILDMLYRHIETPEFSTRVHWQPHTLTCWDNRCTQHHAVWDYYPSRRTGRRVTVLGDRPFLRRDDGATRADNAARPLPYNQRPR